MARTPSASPATDPHPLRFGIAGIGAGASNLLQGFTRNPHVRITAAADLRAEPLGAFGQQFGAVTFQAVEEMCRSSEVDVVWVATPNHLHAEHAIMAAEHRKHVIVSKPMAMTIEECEAMIAAANRNGVKLLVGHSQGLAATIRKVADLVRSGGFGKLGMVHTWHYTDWVYRPRLPAELDENLGGGAVFRQAPHQIDIVRIIGGQPLRSVRASTLQLDPDRPTTGAYVAYLEFDDGTPATLVYSGYGHFRASELTEGRGRSWAQVTGQTTPEEERAMKESVRYSGRAADHSGHEEPGAQQAHSIFGLTLVSCQLADIRQSPRGLFVYDANGKHEVPVPADERGEAEFEEMYQAVRHGRPILHDGRWGQATHEVTLAILESARQGTEITLSRQTPVAP